MLSGTLNTFFDLDISVSLQVEGDKFMNVFLALLAVEELCVCDIAYLLNLSMASASHHLRKLANQNILDTRREGKIIYYFIKDEEIRDFFNQLG